MRALLAFVVAAVIQLAESRPASFKLGNYVPFCQFPETFSADLKPYAKSAEFKAQYLSTNWFVVASKHSFFLKGCKCAQLVVGDFSASLDTSASNIYCVGENGDLIARSFNVKVADELAGIEKSEAAFNFQFGTSNPYEYVLDAAADFTWVILGEPCRKGYLLLSVTPDISKDVLKTVDSKLKELGFNTDNQFERTNEKCLAKLPKADLIPDIPKKVESASEAAAARSKELKKKDEERSKKEQELEKLVEAILKKEAEKEEEAKKQGVPFIPSSKSGPQGASQKAV